MEPLWAVASPCFTRRLLRTFPFQGRVLRDALRRAEELLEGAPAPEVQHQTPGARGSSSEVGYPAGFLEFYPTDGWFISWNLVHFRGIFHENHPAIKGYPHDYLKHQLAGNGHVRSMEVLYLQ